MAPAGGGPRGGVAAGGVLPPPGVVTEPGAGRSRPGATLSRDGCAAGAAFGAAGGLGAGAAAGGVGRDGAAAGGAACGVGAAGGAGRCGGAAAGGAAGAAAERSAGPAGRRQEARDAERPRVGQRAEPVGLPSERLRAARPSAAGLLVVPSAFHRDRFRLALARQRAARFARATARQQTASPSELLWRAAPDEALSCRLGSPGTSTKKSRDQQISVRPHCGGRQRQHRFYLRATRPQRIAIHGLFMAYADARGFRYGRCTGSSSGILPGNSSGRGTSPGSRTGGGTSGRGLPGGASCGGGSVGLPGVGGGISGGSIGIYSATLRLSPRSGRVPVSAAAAIFT